MFQAPQLKLLEKGLPNKFTCYENANVSFIVNILSMAINFGLYSYLKGLPYASDLTWSKFQFILAINILAQSIGAVFATFLVISEQIDKFAECADVMQALYVRQYIYTVGNFIVIVF